MAHFYNFGSTEHLFTGKERDAESGNDYFGARYYNSPMGRFMSPDWSAKAEPVPYAKMGNPQTLNLYAFVGNNPISHVDVDGHVPLSWGGFEDCSERHDCNGGGQTALETASNEAAQYGERFSSSEVKGATAGAQLNNIFAAQKNEYQQPSIEGPIGQVIRDSGFPLDVISVSGNTTTFPLYNSLGEIIGTEASTNNLDSNGTGSIVVVNTNQSVSGSPTETITLHLTNWLTNSTSVKSSDGSANIGSSTSYDSHTHQATVITNNYNTNTMNIRVYNLAGDSGPVLVSNTNYNVTYVSQPR